MSRTDWFDLAGNPCLVFEPKPGNAVESIGAILVPTFQEEPLEAYFWNIQLFPPLGILTVQKQPEKAVDSILTTPYSEHFLLSIPEHTAGFPVILNNRVTVKVITEHELIRQSDTQQQLQQQQSLLGFRGLL
jgi:hypothetical protein